MLSTILLFSREFHSHLTKSFWLESDCKQSTDFRIGTIFRRGAKYFLKSVVDGAAPPPPQHRDQLYSCVMGRSISRLQSGTKVSALADFSILATDRQKTNHNISLKLLTIPSHELWYKSSYIPPFHIMCIDICT